MPYYSRSGGINRCRYGNGSPKLAQAPLHNDQIHVHKAGVQDPLGHSQYRLSYEAPLGQRVHLVSNAWPGRTVAQNLIKPIIGFFNFFLK